MASAFPNGWWSFDLGKYRPADGTYQLYPADSVPPLDPARLDGTFPFLPASTATEPTGALAELVEAARSRGLVLPATLVRFFADPALGSAVPSCTACEWDLSTEPVPCRATPGGYTIRVLRDQQDVLFWYVHLGPEGESVICSPIPFDQEDLEVDREVVVANTWTVAPSFEAFVYRFWLENVLWDLVNSKDPQLDAEQRAYLDHYRR
jgi:hypothetical protein